MLVINQLAGSYECRSEVLITYHDRSMQLLKEFKDFRLEHVPRLHNEEANQLAQHSSGYEPMINAILAIGADDWRKEIIDYSRDPSKKAERVFGFKPPSMCSLKMSCITELLMGFFSDA